MNRREFIKKTLEGIVIAGGIGSIPLISGCGKDPVSPDDDLESITKIAFNSQGYPSDIYTINPDGSDLKQLTYEGNNRYPDISPDGKKIAFASNREGKYNIYTINPDGSEQVRLTHNEDYNLYPVWSPDGTKIAFVYNGYEIYTMDIDGENIRRLISSDHGATYLSWSSKNKMAFTSGIGTWPANPRIHTVDLETLDLELLMEGASHLSWSPDGDEFVYSHWIGLGRDCAYIDSIYKTDLDKHQFLVDGYVAKWHTIDKIIVYDLNHTIHIINSDGTNQTYLTGGLEPAWSPFLK